MTKLTNEFNDYKNSLNQKVYQLKEALPQEEFAFMADKQWIYEGRCLVEKRLHLHQKKDE